MRRETPAGAGLSTAGSGRGRQRDAGLVLRRRQYLGPTPRSRSPLAYAEEGAAIVDVGGESTRPGSEGVSAEEELRRIEPVLERLEGVPVSVDTSKAEVARRALELGAVMVNDVTALRGDPELAGVVADADAYLCLMHMLGEPRTMQDDPRYDDVVSEVKAFLEERLSAAVDAGIPEEHVCLDPGIGFGKTVEHNLELLRGSKSSSPSAGRCSSERRASASSAVSSATLTRSRARFPPGSPSPCSRSSAARRSSASTTSASTSRR